MPLGPTLVPSNEGGGDAVHWADTCVLINLGSTPPPLV